MFRLTSFLVVLVVLVGVGEVWAVTMPTPTHHYPFDIDARDEAGGNHGVLRNGARIVTDPQRGNVLDLDGVNDYVSLQLSNVPGGPNDASVFTIAAWFKMPAGLPPDENRGGIYGEYRSGYPGYKNYFAVTGGGTIKLDNYPPLGGPLASAQVVSDDRWHHISYVQNEPGSFRRKLYIDGVLDASDNSPDSTRSTTSPDAVSPPN